MKKNILLTNKWFVFWGISNILVFAFCSLSFGMEYTGNQNLLQESAQARSQKAINIIFNTGLCPSAKIRLMNELLSIGPVPAHFIANGESIINLPKQRAGLIKVKNGYIVDYQVPQ